MNPEKPEMIGIVDEIERYAINDGHGIRSIVFLKGCPLRCLWCSNPESQAMGSQVMYWKTRCIGCRACVKACPEGAITWDDETGHHIDREKCTGCGVCIDACNSEALTLAGKKMSVEEVVSAVKRDRPFYDQSGGGVTFSGGECMCQVPFMKAVCKRLKEEGITTCIETAGFVSKDLYEEMLPYLDDILFDLKAMDDGVHKKNTGVSNRLILENLSWLLTQDVPVKVRIPVIPGVNNSEENMRAVAAFLKEQAKMPDIGLLPYHRLGVSKYEKLDMTYGLDEIEPPKDEEMRIYADIFEKEGFRVTMRE